MKTNKINVVLSLNKTVVSTYTDTSEDNITRGCIYDSTGRGSSSPCYAKYKAKNFGGGQTGTGAQTTGGYSANSGCCP